MNHEVQALLRLGHGVSKEGANYDYVGVFVDGDEVSRMYMRRLELRALFPAAYEKSLPSI